MPNEPLAAAEKIAGEPQETIERLLLLMVLGVLTPDEFRAIYGLEPLANG